MNRIITVTALCVVAPLASISAQDAASLARIRDEGLNLSLIHI